MMKKNVLKLLSFALCLMFFCPSALAQETYVIGETANRLLINALNSGQVLTADAKLDIDIDAAALGISEEDAAILNMVLDVLDQLTLTGGFGLTQDGIRLVLEGELADEATGKSVALDAAANVTLDGLSLESSLIEGRRLTARWETLLALAGLDEEELAVFTAGKDMVRMLQDTDIEQALAELTEEILPLMEQAVTIAMPYFQTCAEFVAGLPIDVAENLNEEGYPATATEIAVTVTEKDLGVLLTQLCDQAAQDTALSQALDPLLSAYADGATTAMLIEELRAAAAQMTDTSLPIVFFVGMNEESVPLYFEIIMIDEESNESIYSGFFCYEDVDSSLVIELIAGLYDAQSNPYVSIYAGVNHLGDPADPNVHNLQIVFHALEEETPLMEFVMDYTAVPVADSELPAYDVSASYSMYADDGTQLVAGSQARAGQTAAGGEFTTGSSQGDTYLGDSRISVTATADTLVEPKADGGITGHYRISESMPYAGISNFTIDAALNSEAYDPAQVQALEPLELETLTNDEMNALIDEVLNLLLNDKLSKAIEVLPPEVLEMIMAAQSE